MVQVVRLLKSSILNPIGINILFAAQPLPDDGVTSEVASPIDNKVRSDLATSYLVIYIS